MIYELGAKGLVRVDVSANNTKNSLPIGAVLHLNGYNDPDYVIVKNLGIDEKFGHGARYQTVNLLDGTFSLKDAFSLQYLEEKQDNRIQTYITKEVKTPDEVLTLFEKATALENITKTKQEQARKVTDDLIAKGKELALKVGIETVSWLIVAEHEEDDCDLHTDYFNTIRTQLIILATSTSTRDSFAEMRKAAAKFEKTAHLAKPLEIDSNGDARTETNKTYWHPADEHREKYSGGSGYYLKAERGYSTGWSVSKMGKWNGKWSDEVYISLAQVNLFEKAEGK